MYCFVKNNFSTLYFKLNVCINTAKMSKFQTFDPTNKKFEVIKENNKKQIIKPNIVRSRKITFFNQKKTISLCCKLLFIILLNSKRFEILKTSVRKMVHNFNFFQCFGGSLLGGSWDPEQFSGSFTKYPRCPEIFEQHSVPLLCPVWSWNFEQGHGLHFYGYAN